MWKWLNEWRIVERLAEHREPEEVDDILDALEEVIKAPFEPNGLDAYCLPSTSTRPERWVAWLPKQFVLTYRPYVNGPPPHAGKHVVVLAFNSFADIVRELGPEDAD